MIRHFTATAFVVHQGKTLLHWHKKLQQWMPPGGHLLEGEDPVTGALREVREETGLDAEVLVLSPRFEFSYPEQVAAPYAVLIEDIEEAGGPHQHIDFIYFCRSLDGEALRPPSPDDALAWVTEDQLRRNEALPLASCGLDIAVAEDVRVLALEAIRLERELAHR
jgi:ADP-ribose pyrophosphatase YjhB (NUDIX family)